MVALMNRSIDLLEELARESDNVFRMNRRGYLFATADPARVGGARAVRRRRPPRWAPAPCGVHDRRAATTGRRRRTASRGSPPGSTSSPIARLIRRDFPWLTEDTVALLHARRCGWFSGQQLGMYMLERARDKGVRLLEGRVEAVETRAGASGRCR